MIKQEMKQGGSDIRIESAESIEDARKHGFKIDEGEYTRYFVNGKPCRDYMTLLKFIMEETKKNNAKFIPDKQGLVKMRMELLRKQNDSMRQQIYDLKVKYGNHSIPKETMNMLDGIVEKLDDSGVRVRE